jgi:hypothetical protein
MLGAELPMARTCAHLEPLEAELERSGVRIGEPMPSPYGPDWGLWSEVDCVFEAASLRARLGLPEFILFEEYTAPGASGRSWAGTDTTPAR